MRLTIDGREVECRSGATILEAARGAGIAIPSLCDHPGLEPFAGCRICLVEVSGRRDLAPACATPVEEGQVVRTQTPEITALRKRILEFLLAEHPYACLVCPEKTSCDDLKATIRKTGEVTGCVLCPENGVCELQRVAAEIGLDKVDLPAVYRNLEVHKEDPFFDRDYNLCILCGRCVRVCEEVRGAAVLSFVHRGGRTEVGTALGRTLLETGCRFCGACVDVCPTGALVERAVRPRPGATPEAGIVCPFCGQGCLLALRVPDGRVLDATPIDALPNRGQACVKGRFLVRGALEKGRILEPYVLKNGKLEAVPLAEALDRAADGLRRGAAGRTALVVPSQVGLEDAFAFHAFGRDVIGAGAMTAEPAGAVEGALLDFEDRHGFAVPATRKLSEIGTSGAILAWDLDLPEDHPIAWLEVVKAVRGGAALVTAGPGPASPVVREAAHIEVRPNPAAAAARLTASLLAKPDLRKRAGPASGDFAGAFGELRSLQRRDRRDFEGAARILAAGRPVTVLFDAAAVSGPEGPGTLDGLWDIALLLDARLVPLAGSANERGVHGLGLALGPPAGKLGLAAVWAGLEAREFEALYLAGPLPDLGGLRPPFLVCQDTHWSRNAERADVVLPAAAFAEAGGTWVNTEGRVRTYAPAVPLPGSARPDGVLLAALAERLGRPGSTGAGPAAGLAEICRLVPGLNGYSPAAGEFFLRAPAAGSPRFVTLAPPPRRRGRRPAAKPVAPSTPGPVLRGFDLVAGNRGYARTRRVR